MDCRVTSTKRRQHGATLSEVLFGIGIGVLVLSVFTAFVLFQGRSLMVLLNMADMDQANRNTVDRMSREIRQVNKVLACTTNSIDFEDTDKGTLTYRYSAGARTLSRIKGNDTTILLREVTALNFALMQRNIVEGEYAYYPADTIEEAKVIGMTWEVSRSVMGRRTGVSGFQTVRIVIRKA